ncbi:Aminomethyltransferase [Zhongshania aliphaticivorans]|uniref:aminomethyltransferase n=1 Tax=Zhongshania aliphaticivorans TaxID=1470434 RepID=A0A5S9NFU2_9GAMM|nr:glycine cleavage system aminomethyltransferase GcvT [Zhongshania aliphaticivorans]CAA0089340.1 Aminomethyltransferase [Zhongshania aliphaticivorans]CAA0096058.1 Aminomethyltransferase [Zhongshania aliphaticivorans]
MSTDKLLTTPLNALHREMSAKMVPFAGYDMPVQYPMGVLKEHLHVRSAAGLFDVSHMGQIRVQGHNVAEELEKLMPQDVLGLPINRQRYGLLTNEQGGVLDDLMFANCGDHYLVIVNAACKDQDYAWLRAHLPAQITLEMLEGQGLLALQGPKARQVLARLAPATEKMVFMDTGNCTIADIPCWLSCSGYTGEDGFEISVAQENTEALARVLLAETEVEFIGLGARDSLRLEAGLCLYGHDMSDAVSPVEANLLWAISKCRRPGAERAGGYPGANIIALHLLEGTESKRVLLDVEGRAPVREGADIVNDKGDIIGHVTSGGFGPSVGGPIVMAYVNNLSLASGDVLFASVRKKLLPMTLRQAPFVKQRYHRG